MYNVPSKARKYLPGKQCDNHPIICPMRENNNLRWLDIVFQGQYLPRLSVNYVAINKDLEKLTPQLY